MIINFYIPESDAKLIDHLRLVSGQKRRSLSFVLREALEYYLLNVLQLKSEELHIKKGGEA